MNLTTVTRTVEAQGARRLQLFYILTLRVAAESEKGGMVAGARILGRELCIFINQAYILTRLQHTVHMRTFNDAFVGPPCSGTLISLRK